MIEAMEQQIINSINNRWTKNKDLRREIDMDKVTESFRVICSSRSSILGIIKDMKNTNCYDDNREKLRMKMNEIYKWIIEECVKNLTDRYKVSLKDKKKELEYKTEVLEIEKSLQALEINIVNQTLEKLLKFHNVNKRYVTMIQPKRDWTRFDTEDDKIKKFREWKIITPKATSIKKLYYKGFYTNKPVECDVVGVVDDNEIVLDINGQLHSIHPDCFADMQKKDRYKDRYIILDIETPMSFRNEDGIREVALIVIEDYREIDRLHLAVINDEEKYKNGYGYGLEAIEENEELKLKFKEFISKYKYPIIAHNATFDRRVLRYWGWVSNKRKFYCSRDNIRRKKKLKSYTLEYLLNYYGIKSTQEHKAIQDVLDLLELLKIVKIEEWIPLGESPNYHRKRVILYKNSKEKRDEDKKKLEEAKENLIENIFDNKKVVFTGDMKEDRAEMRAIAIKYGAISPASISSKTDILVVGKNPGSKLRKAKELGTKIITEQEFWEIINSAYLK